MAITSRLSLRYPVASDTADVPRDIGNLASDIDKAAIFAKGTFASRPTSTVGTPGIDGRYYFATDTSRLYLDTGSSWVEVASGTDSVTSAMIAADAVGSSEIATDAVDSAEIKANAVTAAKLSTAVADLAAITNGSNTRRGSANDNTERTTTSTTGADVTNVSTSITVATGSATLVGVACELKNASGSFSGYGKVVAGSATITPSDAQLASFGTTYRQRWYDVIVPSALSGTGAQTIKLQFYSDSGTQAAYVKNAYIYAFNFTL